MEPQNLDPMKSFARAAIECGAANCRRRPRRHRYRVRCVIFQLKREL